jgi:hypothetical protein
MSRPRSAQVVRSAAPALLLAWAVLLPFVAKPFTMDDTFFLLSARHAASDPLHPSAFVITWDRMPERASSVAPTGPLTAWLLLPSIASPQPEVVAHLTMLLLLSLSILATVSLALRLGLAPSWAAGAGVILAMTPTALAMAGTAMPDVPAMALGAAGIERLLAWRDERRVHDGVLAALLLGLAPLARTHLMAVLGVAAMFMVDDLFSLASWRKGPWWRWIPLACAPAITVAALFATADPAPDAGDILGTAARLSTLAHLASNTVALPVHWVLAMGFSLPWAVLHGRSMLARPWAFLLGTGVAGLLLRQAHPGDAPYFVAPIAGLGFASLWDVISGAVRERDGRRLTLGTWMLVPVPAVAYWHMPPKYLLASAPAAALLLAMAMAERSRLGRPVLAATAVLGAILGVAILRADSALADVGRTAARTLIAPSVAAGHRVWYVGHWGFQWYAEEAGARCWSAAPPYPVEGDLIAYADNLAAPLARRELESLVHLSRVEDRRPGGRVMSKGAGAGFYSNGWGYLPWAWGTDPVDAVDLWLARSAENR